MEYIENTRNIRYKNTAVTMGKFDGIHAGHRALIDKMKDYGGLKKVVFTFSLSPAAIQETQAYEENFKSIYSNAERREILSGLGVDAAVFYPFDRETMEMEAADFVKKVLAEQLDAKVLIVGEDFCFGHKRRGDTNLLEKLSGEYGYKLVVVKKEMTQYGIISSSKIRDAIIGGDLSAANEMLCFPYFIMGNVREGKRLGRKINSPTINIYPDGKKLLPPYGVYATKTRINNVWYEGVTDIGIRPTVEETLIPRAECHLFDFEDDIYESEVLISFHKFIRSEKRFGSVEALMEQIERDKENVRTFFSSP